MERELRLAPGRRIFAGVALALLTVGVVWPPLGFWTLPIVGAWFVGAQKPLIGLVRLAAIQLSLAFVAALPGGWTPLWSSAPDRLIAVGIGLAPLLAYRLMSPRVRPGLAGVALPALAVSLTWGLGDLVPATSLHMALSTPRALHPLTEAMAAAGPSAPLYVSQAVAGLAAWAWIRDRRGGFGPAALAGLPVLSLPLLAAAVPLAGFEPLVLASLALAVGVVAIGLVVRPFAAALPPVEADLAWLRAPGDRAALSLTDAGLSTEDGRVYPVKAGVVRFVEPAGLAGQNGRLSRLYRDIAGFYDDSQRIYSALMGLDRAAYVRNYLRDLDPRPGDRVLETSIGTGLSFQALRPDIEAFGVDLSGAMLDVCRETFSRQGRRARLYAANAEALPFADETFDVVFHVGGINFFDDKAAAISEMIRVARPGARILIADETEKHVKAVYQATPGTRGYFQDRDGPVAPPLALLPQGLADVTFRTLMNDQFYVISFVKPDAKQP